MSRSWAKGSTRAWRRIRARVLARDGHRCMLQLNGCTGHATHVHHVHGRAATGDDPEYLLASCAPCNLKAGDPAKANPQPKRISRW